MNKARAKCLGVLHGIAVGFLGLGLAACVVSPVEEEETESEDSTELGEVSEAASSCPSWAPYTINVKYRYDQCGSCYYSSRQRWADKLCCAGSGSPCTIVSYRSGCYSCPR